MSLSSSSPSLEPWQYEQYVDQLWYIAVDTPTSIKSDYKKSQILPTTNLPGGMQWDEVSPDFGLCCQYPLTDLSVWVRVGGGADRGGTVSSCGDSGWKGITE